MLQHAIKNDAELQRLQDEIFKRSSCIFQWVVFVLDRAIWQYREGYYISYILKKLYNTLADLDSLFKDILQGLNKNKQNKSRSLKLMLWIGFARRPLSLTELRFAMIVDSATSYPSLKQHQLSPLLWTADNGHRTVVKLLLEKSADVESKDSDNRTPLLWAVENGHKAVIELLLEGYEKALGPEHTSTLDTANNLASPYIGLGKMQEAEAMRQRTLEGYENALGPEHTSMLYTVYNLGNLYSDQGKIKNAEAMRQQALEGYKKTLGSEHTLTLETLYNLGSLCSDQGKMQEARHVSVGGEKILATLPISQLLLADLQALYHLLGLFWIVN